MAGTKTSGNKSEKRGHRPRSGRVIHLDEKTAGMLLALRRFEGDDINEIAILAIRAYYRESLETGNIKAGINNAPNEGKEGDI